MYTETEIKLHVKDLEKLARRLLAMNATLIAPRTHEMNLRFDTPAGTLAARSCVLRLRQDAQPKLTYKGPTSSVDGVARREEIEFTVSDFGAAQRFLEALGYELISTYEKYRTTYQLGDLHIMLDEMPYGDFIEIEGEDTGQILGLAEKLTLNTELSVKMSYLQIFDLLCAAEDIAATELTFEALTDGKYNLAKIDVTFAD